MKTFSLTAATLALVTLGGTTALAGGLTAEIVEAPIVPVVQQPAPVFVPSDWTGFYAGGVAGTGDVTVGTNLDDPALETDATSYGLYAGYNLDLGTFVIGGEISYDVLEFDVNEDLDNSVLRVGARAGYDAGAFLPYVTAGFANLTTEAFGDEVDDNGYYYGVGVDYRATDNIVVGAQYLRHEFEDFNEGGADIQADLAQIRIAYQF